MGRFNFSVKRTNFVFMKEADKQKKDVNVRFFSIVLKKLLNPIHEATFLNTLIG